MVVASKSENSLTVLVLSDWYQKVSIVFEGNELVLIELFLLVVEKYHNQIFISGLLYFVFDLGVIHADDVGGAASEVGEDWPYL